MRGHADAGRSLSRRRTLTAVLAAVFGLWPHLAAPGWAGDEDAAGQAIVMSAELLEGSPAEGEALHVQGDLRAASAGGRETVYAGVFRIDAGASDSIAPASALTRIGIAPAGVAEVQRADGSVQEYAFGLVRIEFLGQMREGRVLFGPEDVEPAIGLSALEAIGYAVDAQTGTLQPVTGER